MKTFANGKLSFGLGAVNVAKRGVVSEPELVINPTVGAFRITPPVSRALGLANGDYVMFISTVAEVDKAIAERNPELVALCAENGIDINTPEGVALSMLNLTNGVLLRVFNCLTLRATL